MKNIIYIHICCINNYKEIFTKLLINIHKSKLYNIIDEIRCVILGDYFDIIDILNDPKIKIIYKSSDYNLYEFKIMELIYKDALEDDFNILYLHTKGIRHYNTAIQKNIEDWVDMLIYYNIIQHNICIDKLIDYDAVGINLQANPWHFSGNFWWSKSSHIKNLGLINDKSYNGPEFYITKKTEAKYLSLWNSCINHYNIRYPFNLYINKFKLLSFDNGIISMKN